MGKKWDYDVPSVEIWKECLRVLKPGGTALIFAGSRTQHRMTVNVEDAGFELKDTIMWLYGCLSEDTEILTKDGFKLLHKTTKDDKIMVYDTTKNIYKWETPERWSVYRVHEDTCYRIKSDTTDQIVSRGHRCLVKREGRFVFKEAWELSEMEQVPVLSDNFYTLQEKRGELLLQELCRKSKRLVKKVFSKWQGKEKTWEGFSRKQKSSLERWSNLLQETRELQGDKICEVSKGVFTDGEKRWICDGTPFDNGSILGDMLKEGTSNTSYQSRPTRQQTGKSDVISIKQGTQTTRRARITKINYSGIIFCPTVSTGAFVARRNGKIFITGNSGFPKATDISKQLDKKAGETPKLVGYREDFQKRARKNGVKSKDYLMAGGWEATEDKVGMITEPATEEAKLWNGWKSHGLKPAYEPILVAVKPNDGTYANNALKHGVAGLNIDGGRIGTEDKLGRPIGDGTKDEKIYGKYKAPAGTRYGDKLTGRFPANIILDEEAGEMLDEQSGKTGALAPVKAGQKGFGGEIYGKYKQGGDDGATFYGDGLSGASRFFYCAKASKSERNAGCENMEDKQTWASQDKRESNSFDVFESDGRPKTLNKNNHPTVKPIKLMEYLCILTKTPTGGIVLDPFAGSGTTGVACKNTGRPFILIEMTPEYIPIIEARTGEKCSEEVKYLGIDIEEKQKELQKEVDKVVEEVKDKCDCGGRIVNIKGGRCCEDCLKDY